MSRVGCGALSFAHASGDALRLVQVRRARPFCMSSVPRVGVSVALFQNAHVLLVLRGNEPYAGRWSLPGGKWEAGAETLVEGVRRELTEETGLGIADVTIGETPVHRLEVRVPDGEPWVIHVFAGICRYGVSPAAMDDAAAVKWVGIDSVSKLDTTVGLERAIRAARSAIEPENS